MKDNRFMNFSVATAVILSGIGTIKFSLPAFSIWFVIAGLLSIATVVRSQEFFMRIQYVDFRIFFPWLAFVFSIILSGLYNLDAVDLAFSAATIAKFIAITTIFALLISMQISIKNLESFFTLSMLVGAGGFAVAMLNDDWVMRYGDGRLAWIWAWGGVFWKMGAYALPFFVCRVLQKPSWFEMPALTLATTIIALDGSRTGLLVVVAIIVTTAICIKFFKPNANFKSFIICMASIIMAYAFIQPAISHAIASGGFWTMVGSSGLCLFLAAAYFQLWNRHHTSAKFMVAGLLALISVFCIHMYENPVAYQRLGGGDPTRMNMILHGIQSAIANFPLGGGLGSTTADDHGVQVHIHMTYLQLLSDVGLIGLLSYACIFLLGFVWFFRLEKEIRTSALSIVAIVCIYLTQGLFAPLSNEITEWFPVVLALSVLYNIANSSVEILQNRYEKLA